LIIEVLNRCTYPYIDNPGCPYMFSSILVGLREAPVCLPVV
jgi:hypothetical protein